MKFLAVFAFAVLIVVALCLGTLASSDSLGAALAFFFAILLSFFTFLVGIWLVISLKGKRRWFGIALMLVVPATLFPVIEIGRTFTWEVQAGANGILIAQALDRYRADHGTYPQYLQDLTPQYIDNLHQPPKVWGWLYKTTPDAFMLGYVSYVDRMGYSTCLYSASTTSWDCEAYSDLFHLSPTPFPDWKP
ncbi:MAG: hypothetical protein ABI700_09120 [Chloroflexota bacterium]